MTLTLFDSITVADIPTGSQAVAGYVGGNWPTWDALIAKFPHIPAISIAVNASQNAQCLDVEQGDATPADVPSWLARVNKLYPNVTPILYTSAAQVAVVRKAAGTRRCLIWSAHYTDKPHLCSPKMCGYPAADATQYANHGPNNGHYDMTLMSPEFFAAIAHRGTPAPKETTVALPYQVDFRGLPACPCLAAWIPAYEAELHRRKLLTGPLRIYQLIGGAPASGGTHVDGGAEDDDRISEQCIWVARQMGADASWHRPVNWDGKGGMEHAHHVLTGCPHNGPARYQIDAVRAGFNGLGLNGHGAKDTGPRPLSGRTWQQGILWAKQQAAAASKENVVPIKPGVATSTPYSRTYTRIHDAVTHPDVALIAKGRVPFRAFVAATRVGLNRFKKN